MISKSYQIGQDLTPAGEDALPELSNLDFLHELTGGQLDAAWCAVLPNDPLDAPRGRWFGGPAVDPQIAKLIEASDAGEHILNPFYTVSTFQEIDGELRRRIRNVDRQFALVLDDIGTGPGAKVPADRVTLPPTFAIETSPENVQVGYKIRGDTDPWLVEALVEQLTRPGLFVDSGGKDPGQKSATRYMRLPRGWNGKAKYGEPWRHVLRLWQPDRAYTLEEIARAYGIDSAALQSRRRAGAGRWTGTETDLDTDPMFRVLNDHGYVRDIRGHGAIVDVTCPWVNEHSAGDDSGSAYFPGIHGAPGGFKCWHGHCIERKYHPDLTKRMMEVHGVDWQEIDREKQTRKLTGQHAALASVHEMMRGATPGEPTPEERPTGTLGDVVALPGVPLPQSPASPAGGTPAPPVGPIAPITKSSAEECRDLMCWVKDSERTAVEVCERIVLRQLDPVDTDMVVKEYCYRADVSSQAMRSLLKQTREKYQLLEGNRQKAVASSDLLNNVVALSSGKFFLLDRSLETGALGIRNIYRKDYPAVEDDVVDMLIANPERQLADGAGWRPISEKFFHRGPQLLVNTYQGPTTRPVPGEPTLWLQILDHVYGSHTDTVLDHMAFSLQYPDEKIRWQILVYGTPRTGKTLALRPLKRIWQDALTVINDENVDSGWGDFLAGAKVVVFNEVYRAGENAVKSYNRLKPLLADSGCDGLNIKGGAILWQENRYSIYMSSNFDDALRIPDGDNKVLVLEGPRKPMKKALYDQFSRACDDPAFIGQCYHFLASRDVSSFSYGRLPLVTNGLKRMIENSQPHHETEIIALLRDSKQRYCLGGFTLDQLMCAADLRPADKEKHIRGITRALRANGFQDGRIYHNSVRIRAWFRETDETTTLKKAAFDTFNAPEGSPPPGIALFNLELVQETGKNLAVAP